MKRNAVVFFISLLIILSSCNRANRKNTISISGAWALYPLTVKWAEEYRKVNPEIRIDISAGGAGKGMADVLGELVEIGMVSREINPEELKRGALPVAVAKDAVVAVISEKNPSLNDILSSGLTVEDAISIWITGNYKTWGDVLNSDSGHPVHVYTRSDACGAAEIWALFLGKKQEDLIGIGVYGDPGLAQAVKQDSLGIGFNNIGYVYDFITKVPVHGLKIVPIDTDSDGRISQEESFYDSMDNLIDAIVSGKYPSPPSRELYFVLKGKPAENKALREFMTWILTEGQIYVREAGYVPLQESITASELKKLE
jgi:phosphate transport system substrate-binding protein